MIRELIQFFFYRCPNFGEPCEIPNGKICTSSSASKLAEVFPSLLTAEGKKSPELSRPVNPPVESSEAETVILAENLEEKLKFEHEEVDNVDECCTKQCTKAMEEEIQQLEISSQPMLSAATSSSSPTTCNHATGAPVPPPKKATTAKELRDLMYQHYSVGKGKLKKPSANAIKKGKVPPPACSNITPHSKAHDESTDEMSEESDDEDNDTCCSETSKGTTTTASESHGKNGAHCSCCYCEVFGSGGQSVAPVSRNYPEMRERLRLLLSKKKRKNQGQPPPPPPPKTRPPPPRASSASSSASSNLLSSRSESKVKQPSVPPQQTTPPQEETQPKDEKALDELLDFIEGNQKNSNEKKKAKKERQKQKKIEEIRKKEDDERRQKAAIEAERKRRDEEARRADEAARMMDKKKKKKEAQRLKKLAAKGIDPPPPMESPTSEGGVSSLAALEELKAKHMRELQARLTYRLPTFYYRTIFDF